MAQESRLPEGKSITVQAMLSGKGLPVIGLDMSSQSAGVVILDRATNVLFQGTITPKMDGPERLYVIYTELIELVRRYGPFDTAVREGYSMGSTNKPYLTGEVGGVTQAALYPRAGRVLEAAPKQLKKFAASNASATKGEVMEAVKHRYGFITACDDIADAYVLARIGACLAGYTTPKERAALEVLAAITAAGVEGPKPKKRRAIARGASVLAHELVG